LTALVKMH